MADDNRSIVNKTGSAIVAVVTLLFCMATVVWLILKGDPANGLHSTAMNGSYTTMALVLGALVLGALGAPLVAQVLPLIKKPS